MNLLIEPAFLNTSGSQAAGGIQKSALPEHL
jgi:hypothetical protein